MRRLSKALLELGVERGDRVALMSENGPHWPTVDFAVLGAGAALVPIYPTLLADQSSYIAGNCGAKVVIAETPTHLDGLLAHADEMPAVRQFVLIKGTSSDPRVITLDKLMEKGAGADAAEFEARARAVRPEDLATFIYTSGTTGTPKGVMLTHGNIASNVSSGARGAELPGGVDGAVVPAAVARLRAHGRLLLLPARLHDRLRGVGGGGVAEHGRGQAARLRLRAAGLREGPQQGAGAGGGGVADQAEDLRLGPRGWDGRRSPTG